jgi:alkylation response protein AidB-like acyl-CoA dehydrogenase
LPTPTRQFIDNEVVPRIDELEKHDWKLARELVGKAADLGLIGANIPEEYGGLGLDQTSGALVGENIGRCASFATTLGAESGIGLLPISTSAPKRRSRSTCRRSLHGRVDHGLRVD